MIRVVCKKKEKDTEMGQRETCIASFILELTHCFDSSLKRVFLAAPITSKVSKTIYKQVLFFCRQTTQHSSRYTHNWLEK